MILIKIFVFTVQHFHGTSMGHGSDRLIVLALVSETEELLLHIDIQHGKAFGSVLATNIASKSCPIQQVAARYLGEPCYRAKRRLDAQL